MKLRIFAGMALVAMAGSMAMEDPNPGKNGKKATAAPVYKASAKSMPKVWDPAMIDYLTRFGSFSSTVARIINTSTDSASAKESVEDALKYASFLEASDRSALQQHAKQEIKAKFPDADLDTVVQRLQKEIEAKSRVNSI